MLIVVRILDRAAPWGAPPSGVVYIQLSIAYGNRIPEKQAESIPIVPVLSLRQWGEAPREANICP